MATFVGFNTIGKTFPTYKLTDVELVKRDLLNHFQTRKGERVMNPKFGTIIFDLLMDPQDSVSKDAIIEDSLRIIASEPRVKLVTIDVQESDHVIIVLIELLFVPFNIRDSLYVTYKTQVENS